jgi:acyl-CoA reductase-like NAD-dependent aldehyde dehydrogenase
MAAAAETLTPLTFELGGKSANIVFPDADLDTATSMAAMLGAVLLSGQGCALPTRLYVHDDVYEDVASRVVETVEAVNVGDPFDPAVLMGPVVNAAACERILGVITRAVDEGATTTARWPVRRSSDPSCRCCASTTRTRSSPRPTTAGSVCRRTCTRATARADSGWRARSKSAP